MSNTKTSRQNNFDFLRILLALLVVRCHAGLVGWSLPWTEDEYFLGGLWAVQCFFVISGYLVFRSWDFQPKLRQYAEKRARRILPAYIFVVLACGLGLSLLSTLTFPNYFSDSQVYVYIVSHLGFMGFIQNTLPGVFENNVTSYVNGPLWTIKIEVMFYVAVPLIELIARRMNRAFLFAAIYILSLVWNLTFEYASGIYESRSLLRVGEQLPGQMSFFIAGASLYYFKPAFERHLQSACMVSLVILTAYFWTNSHWVYPFYPFALAILVIGFANYFPYIGNFGRYGDFSYGMYIYHYPILQILACLALPLSPALTFGLGFLLSLLVSFGSWKFLESRWLLPSSHYVKADVGSSSPESSHP